MAKVLVIEDYEPLLDEIRESLEDLGHTVEAVQSGEDAVKVALKQKFDLIVSDVRLPGKIDGVGALEQIKSKQPKTRCIVITGYASEDAPTRAIKIQVDDYIYKPFRLATLSDAVDKVLHKEEYAGRFSGLVRRLVRYKEAFVAKAESMRRSREFAAVEAERDKAVYDFFINVRSRPSLFPWPYAILLYDRLDFLQDCFEWLLNHLDTAEMERLRVTFSGYRNLRQEIHNRLNNPPSASRSIRKETPGQVPNPAFVVLYVKIIRAKISEEEVKLAPALRKMSRAEIQANPELLRLFQRIWVKAPDEKLHDN